MSEATIRVRRDGLVNLLRRVDSGGFASNDLGIAYVPGSGIPHATTPLTGQFIVLREPAEARASNWTNMVKNWYDDEASARTEAERLSRTTGKRFVVFHAIAHVQPSQAPLEWHDGEYDPLGDLPF